VIGFALLSALFCLAQDSDQSLGDVARNSKPARKASRVVTNDEIPSAPPVAQASSSVSESDNKQSAEGATDHSDAQATNAQPAGASKSGINVPGFLSNGTVQQAQALLETLKQDHQKLIDNYDKIEKKMAETNDDSLRRVYSESLARRNETLARNEKAIADTESALRAAQAADAQGGTQ
jgi:hypothetical protein